jgi:dihydroorotate dehydrogenase
MYKLLRSILFLFPPELTHYFSMNCLKFLCSIGWRTLLVASFKPRGNHQYSIFNLQFSNKIGLGAGFDKNAKYLSELETLGFGFVEIGTVTPLPQEGNQKPRLFRLPKDKALINRMGFNNDGIKVIAERLRKWQERKSRYMSQDSRLTSHVLRLIIGGNIGKNKNTPNDEAWRDYEICFKELHPYVDYFVVNVSSPNTPGLRELQEKESLRKILTQLQMLNLNINWSQIQKKPILLKIAPDLSQEQLDEVIDLAIEIKLDGIVATNTTISRDQLLNPKSKIANEPGGLSGKPLQARSTEIVRYIYQKTQGRLPIIASGGIFTAEDAKEKLDAGASLLQVWTGFIYEGPGIVKKICKNLDTTNIQS